MEGVELAPLRNLDDFLLASSRFQVPDISDPTRWVNRVINNLLYYQTNYFLVTILMFLLVGVMHPVQMILGCASVAASFALFVYVTNNQALLRRFKRKHPSASIFLVMILGYLIISLFGSVLVFLFGIALPLLVIIIHSSFRLRNIKNKLANKLEHVGLKRTPMGLLLEALGHEQEAGS